MSTTPTDRRGCVAVDDALDRETLVAAAGGVVVQLKRAMANDPGRTIKSLVRQEVENIAQEAVGAWISKRWEQHQRGIVPGSFADFLFRSCGVAPLPLSSPSAPRERACAPPKI